MDYSADEAFAFGRMLQQAGTEAKKRNQRTGEQWIVCADIDAATVMLHGIIEEPVAEFPF